jgi:uncharacterized membrane-anchored protein
MAPSEPMKMAMRTREPRRQRPLSGIHGVARLDRRVHRLLPRLHPGDIAVIEVDDLDRATADALVAARVAAVVNVHPSISGRYPTLGPAVLLNNEIPLLDATGPELFRAVKEGTRLRLDGDTLYMGDIEVGSGTRQDAASVATSLASARAGLSAQLELFAADTQRYMQAERELLLDGVGIPALSTKLTARHVLIVTRGYDFRADLKALKHYISEFRPVLVGVDAGADLLVEAGYTPQIVIGSPDLMSEVALQGAREVVLHADSQGRAAGLPRVQDLRIEPLIFPTSGTSEDAAMLVVDAGDPALIVTVGMRATLEEFLDSSRGGIASTVLTRLKVGGKVIDAKAAAQLYQTRISMLTVLALVVAALLAVVVVVIAADASNSYTNLLDHGWHNASTWVEGLFS